MSLNISSVFSVFLIIMGIILIAAYASIVKSLAKSPDFVIDSTFARVIQGIYTIGVIFIVAGLSYVLCHTRCGCGVSTGGIMYIVFLALLGIVLVVLSGIIVDKAGSMKGGDEAKKWGIGLIVLGSVMTAVSIAIIVHIHRDNIKNAAITTGAGIKSGVTGFFLNK